MGRLLWSAVGSVKIHLIKLVIGYLISLFLQIAIHTYIVLLSMGYSNDHSIEYVKPKSIYWILYCSDTFQSTIYNATSNVFILFLSFPLNVLPANLKLSYQSPDLQFTVYVYFCCGFSLRKNCVICFLQKSISCNVSFTKILYVIRHMIFVKNTNCLRRIVYQ